MCPVLAELRGKLDFETGSVDRSEDLLTAAVFGSLRYLPYSAVLAAVLRAVDVTVAAGDLARAHVRLWPTVPMPEWPGKQVEPDVMVIAGATVVVFEAKLFSPFGIYHDPADVAAPPYHQLAVQYAATKAWASGLGLADPVVVAVTADSTCPRASLDQAMSDVVRLTGAARVGSVKWLPWHRIAEILGNLKLQHRNEQAMVDDLLELMERRGVRKVFTEFAMEDYWLVTAAQRVASSRLYGQIKTFFDELTVVLDTDKVSWSQPGYKAMWLGGASTAAGKPVDWARSFVAAPYWPVIWPERSSVKYGANLALYASFDFLEPALEVGMSIPGPGVAFAQRLWTSHLRGLAKELSALDRYELVLDAGDFSRPSRTSAAVDVTEEWLVAATGAMVNSAHLRIRRRLSIETVTVQQAREELAELQRAFADTAVLWSALRATGHIMPRLESEAQIN
jgi:hypothetical protein